MEMLRDIRGSDPERLRVLLIEDDEADAELVLLELRRGGFSPEWERVDSEPELRRVLALHTWDVVISDFSMPNFSGLRAFDVVRQLQADTPFVFVSGALGEARAVEAMRAGARDYFVKGELGRLNAAVRRELAEASQRQARQQAEAAVRTEQRRLSVAVQASGAGIFEHSVPLNDEAYISDALAVTLGVPSSKVPQGAALVPWLANRIHPEDLPSVQAGYLDFLAGDLPKFSAEVRVSRGPNQWVTVAVFARSESRDDRGRPTHVVGVTLDMTEHRHIESQLRQAQKMEAVGRLAGGVAHDFNNLLTVMFNAATFALESLSEDSSARKDLEDVLDAASRAQQLTSQLLAFSRTTDAASRVVDVKNAVANLDRMLRRLVGEDVEVRLTTAGDVWNIYIDPGSLEQVVLNMAVNARDAMPMGGKLSLFAGNVAVGTPGGRASVPDLAPGEYVVLRISDTGMGMDDDTAQRIFEPFFTTKGLGKGTGLGLSTCYAIITRAGGQVRVESTIGEGTTFHVYLPRCRETTNDIVANTRQRVEGGHEKILLVEDDAMVRTVVARVLKGKGYDVISATDPEEAVRVWEKEAPNVALLITDVVMPGLTGPQLLERLNRQHAVPNVLFMSGYTADAISDRGLSSVDVQLLRKPFSPAELAQRVRSILDAKPS